MTTNTYLILFVTIIISSTINSQELKSNISFIELTNGKTISLDDYYLGLSEDYYRKNKIKICKDDFGKDCEKIPITEIKSINIYGDDRKIIRLYKVLYGPYKEIPRLCILMYKGVNFDFYQYGGNEDDLKIYVSKADNNKVLNYYDYKFRNNRFNLKNLQGVFKNCQELEKEASKKNAHKNHEMDHFYELADNCQIELYD